MLPDKIRGRSKDLYTRIERVGEDSMDETPVYLEMEVVSWRWEKEPLQREEKIELYV